jgi:uncharacterized membrane protein YedE/YeeE
MSEEDPKQVFNQLTEKSVILIALCASPLFFLFAFLGDLGRGRAAGIGGFVILLCVRIFWSLRRRILFWLTLGIVSLCHVPPVFLIPWNNRSYPSIVLLPFALPDFAIVYGAFKLVEIATRRSRQADGANTNVTIDRG